ncbi:Late transcription factor VLTF-4 (1), partial [Monkeypox virus]
NSAENKD